MAPRGSRRSEVAEPQAFHQLGVRGRKTGVELLDTGERDEYGMQPLDDLLSSPEKEPSRPNQTYDDEEEDDDQFENENGDDEDEDDEGSEAMDIETIPGPGPQTVLRRGMQYPIPRSRSPVKTTLMSSPRRNPHLSSPTRQPFAKERDPTVTRKLDFGAKPVGRGKGATNGVNGVAPEEDDADETEDAPEPDDDGEGDDSDHRALVEESLQMIGDMHGSSESPEPEPEPEPAPKVTKASAKAGAERAEADPKKPGRRGRPPKAKPVEEEPPEEPVVEEEPEEDNEPAKPRRGRKPKQKSAAQPKETKSPESRKRPAPEEPEEAEESDNEATEPEPEPEPEPAPEEEPSRQAKRPRIDAPKPSKPTKPAPSKTAPAPAGEPKPRGRPGRKPKAQAGVDAGEDVGETSFAALQRGPPLPKKRGLVSVRHDADEVRTTRSGRHSYRPLDWWRGDKVVQEEEEFKDVSGRDRFVLSTIKEVIRAPQEAIPVKAPKARGRPKPKSKPVQQVEVIEPEEWEINPGVVNGEVILWEPEHEINPPGDEEPVEVMEDRVAISGDAIQTRDILNASFRMAKTLTTPFMGAGVVDLPPGSEKRPKNSRKMHMVFFVHSGKVLVTVNEASFRLSAGGMWFVPRGNYYSITNDYDTDSRIFFSQGCEMSAQPIEPDQSQHSMMA
ncbi:mitotic fidelity of chromosome transmission- protein [Fusarium torreyae]|uniref:CENP-C homolog n=1 Tax=Fusarium torreyae TaxID=1237075 RepID=A0A9W8SJ68_9HYPO|nr:mitotic fidelity of chromosome transmission- protein [Fusarium torreyae]